MKAIKMIGIAALTAMATTFGGAPSAMAESTTLCSADGSGCGIKHTHETSVGKIILLTSVFTIECDALSLGDSLATLANPLVIHTQITFTNCNSCTEEEIAVGGSPELRILKEGHETAKVTLSILIHAVCSPSDCSYNGTSLQGTAKGPLLSIRANGEISFVKQTMSLEPGGFLCPKEAKLDLTTTPLSATYISS